MLVGHHIRTGCLHLKGSAPNKRDLGSCGQRLPASSFPPAGARCRCPTPPTPTQLPGRRHTCHCGRGTVPEADHAARVTGGNAVALAQSAWKEPPPMSRIGAILSAGPAIAAPWPTRAEGAESPGPAQIPPGRSAVRRTWAAPAKSPLRRRLTAAAQAHAGEGSARPSPRLAVRKRRTKRAATGSGCPALRRSARRRRSRSWRPRTPPP